MHTPIISVTVISAFACLLFGCFSFPEKATSPQPTPPNQLTDTTLQKLFSPSTNHNSTDSGLLLLCDGSRALLERSHLFDIAEHSIEAQYYIWNSDKSGKYLLQRIVMAAERGVKVKLLLDDFSVGDRNEQLLAIHKHPNIEIRINNPFIMRSKLGKWLNFAFDFDRLNRRMHNKSLTVDGTVAITGGRNIGDEYFNRNEHLNFIDTEILSIGPVVREVNHSFFTYWNGPWAVPIDQLLEDRGPDSPDNIIRDLLHTDLAATLHIDPPENHRLQEKHFQDLADELIWEQASFIADKPWHDEDAPTQSPKVVSQKILQLAQESQDDILVESAYFVLNEEALQMVDQWHSKGVSIRVLTNSMASNDVLPNHASYAMVRKEMLEQGIQLFELRPDAESCVAITGKEEYCDKNSHLGLHAKAAVFDSKTVYVGSMNFNLRSAFLNTESAMIIESAELARQLTDQIEMNMHPTNSWQAKLKGDTVRWHTKINGEEVISTNEPQTSWMTRVEKDILMLLPGAKYY